MSIETLRNISAWMGIVASALLAFRIASTWLDTTPLTRVLGLTFGATLALSAFASSQAIAQNSTPVPKAIYAVLLGRALAIAIGLAWPWLLRRGQKRFVRR